MRFSMWSVHRRLCDCGHANQAPKQNSSESCAAWLTGLVWSDHSGPRGSPRCRNHPKTGGPMRIALFSTCIVDAMYPRVALATVRILERLGHEVVFPPGQGCCSQM